MLDAPREGYDEELNPKMVLVDPFLSHSVLRTKPDIHYM
jgi:hypothetical protein